MSYVEIGWLVACAIVVHNIEEMLWLPAWTAKPDHWMTPLVPHEFGFAALVLSAFVIVLSAALSLDFHAHIMLPIFTGYAVAMVANALVPHLALSIKTRSYMPGTATGLFLVLPAGLAFVNVLLDNGQMNVLTIVAWGIGVGLGLLVSIPILFRVGASIHKFFKSHLA